MVSIVIPLYNEEQNLDPLYIRLIHSLHKAYEIIFVDDGSTDGSLDVLKRLAEKDKSVRVFSFRKNHGKAEALTLGFQMAKGEKIVTLDADLQDRPEEIYTVMNKLNEGFDVVSGWRKNRNDHIIKIISSKVFNKIVGSFWGIKLHDYNCGLKAYTSRVVKSLRLYGGMHRFIPLLVTQQGFSVTEIPVYHDKRKHGKSKYGISKIWTEMPDIFTMLFLLKYSKRPLHFFGTVGSIMVFIGLLILIYLSIIHFLGKAIGDRPLLFFGGLFVLGGLQIFFTGFLADLIINISFNRTVPYVISNLRYTTDKQVLK